MPKREGCSTEQLFNFIKWKSRHFLLMRSEMYPRLKLRGQGNRGAHFWCWKGISLTVFTKLSRWLFSCLCQCRTHLESVTSAQSFFYYWFPETTTPLSKVGHFSLHCGVCTVANSSGTNWCRYFLCHSKCRPLNVGTQSMKSVRLLSLRWSLSHQNTELSFQTSQTNKWCEKWVI